MTEQTISYGPYIRIYTLYYIGLAVMLAAIGMFTEIVLPVSMHLIVNFAAAMAAGTKFTKDMARAPHKQEKRKLALCFLLVAFILSVVYMTGRMALTSPEEAYPGIGDLSLVAALVMIVAVGLIYYGMSILGLKLGVKSELKRQERLPDDKAI
ncbi:MAG: ABZJ_00895 family protein [Pseudomonadota bacterium]